MAVESERSVRSGTFILEPMEIEDVPEVSRLEHRCFTNPWPESAYRRELRNPEHNYYIVLRHQRDGAPAASDDATSRGVLGLLPLLRSRPERTATEPIVGFAGMWTLYDEAHVTTIASAPEYRGLGLGELLLANLFDAAIARNANWLTLEVRVSNIPAQSLYEKYGFTRQGVRRRYYSDNGEDAYIMWSPSLRDEAFRARLEELEARLRDRLRAEGITVVVRNA